MNNIVLFGVVLFSFVVSFIVYPFMPDVMVSHWGLGGVPNGFLPKLVGLFLMPFVSVLIVGLFFLIPRIDPKKRNIVKFRREYDFFVFVLVFFLFYIHFLVILWNLGACFSMVQLLSPALAVLFYYIGVLFGQKKEEKRWK